MDKLARLTEAMFHIDAANAEDPGQEEWEGVEQPRELLFAKRVHDWVTKLVANPSEALLLAARAHTLRRWTVPREKYPKTNVGYHEWREACAVFHADQAEAILRDVGYSQPDIDRVRSLITKENWEADPEGRALEDADCLAFVEIKLGRYLDEWGMDKSTNILRRTLRKMTPRAREIAATLRLDARCLELLRRASQSHDAEGG